MENTAQKINLEPKNAPLAQARLNELLGGPTFGVVSTILIFLGLISPAVLVLGLGSLADFLSMLLLGIAVFFIDAKLFYIFKIKSYRPKKALASLVAEIENGQAVDLGAALDYKSTLLVNGPGGLVPTDLFQGLCRTPEIGFILYKAGLRAEDLDGVSPQTTLENVLTEALRIAAFNNQETVGLSDFFWGFFKTSAPLQEFFYQIKLRSEDVENLVFWLKYLSEDESLKKDALAPEKWVNTGGIADDWAWGYTPYLDMYGQDLTKAIAKGYLHFSVVSRDEITNQIGVVLSKSHSHLALIGAPGVGRKALVLDFAKKVLESKTVKNLAGKRIIELDVTALLAGANTQTMEVETRLKLVLNDAIRAGNIILFVDNIHSLLLKEGASTVDASQIMVPYLQQGNLQLIGTATPEEWHKINANSTIASLLNRLNVPETNENQTLKILQDISFGFERKYGIAITYQSLKETYVAARDYIPYQAFPAKAIDLLEEACIHAQNSGFKVLTPEILRQTVSAKTNIPTQIDGDQERDMLLNLEAFLHKRVVGQEEAIKAVSNALRRARTGLDNKKRPVASFLFLGPTGVGKTELSKALAEAYFSNENNMVRLDMSEYQEVASISRLLGSGEEAGGMLTKPIREKPFSLVLLDEIEKAHPDVLNIFLEILDDGRVTDNLERVIDFTHSIIIATSNAGSEMIREHFQAGQTDPKALSATLLDAIQKEHLFRPEFLNRFDGVIIFSPLTQPEIKEIAQILIRSVAKRLEEKGISLTVTEEALAKIAEMGYNPAFGARQMRRIIQDNLENFIAQKILAEHLDRGDSIVYDAKDIV